MAACSIDGARTQEGGRKGSTRWHALDLSGGNVVTGRALRRVCERSPSLPAAFSSPGFFLAGLGLKVPLRAVDFLLLRPQATRQQP